MAQLGIVPIKRLDSLYVTVKITKEFKVRAFISKLLFKAAVFVVGGYVDIEMETK